MQAAAIISLTAMLSLLMPPLAYLLSGVPVGLVTLRRGPAIGMQHDAVLLRFEGALSAGIPQDAL